MIRIEFSKRLLDNPHGPGIATRRLVEELNKSKYPVSIVNKKPHVFVNAINYSDPPCGAKTIFRVDGCYFERNRIHLNKGIKESLQRSHGVIYQSKFAKRLNDSIIGPCSGMSSVIYNGFDQSLVPASRHKRNSQYTFLCNAKWRNSKRPLSIANGFRQANLKNARLIMIGDGNQVPSGKNIIKFRHQTPDSLFKWYKIADSLVHLCFIDSCPNTVVEALSFGLPVLCNNIGGTPEIVRQSGLMIKCDHFSFNVISRIEDNIDPDIVAQGMKQIMDSSWSINRKDLDISVTASKYCYFIRKVLEI